MVDFGSITKVFSHYLVSGAFWVIIAIVAVVLIGFFYGYMNRRSKLKYNVIELVRFGNGKVGMNLFKGGIFKVNTFLFGFFDYGNELVTKCSDGRIIQQAQTSELHDVMGKKGFICMRSPRDSNILVPISKFKFENLEGIFAIAPSDYTDASARIFREAVKETAGTWEKILPYIAIGVLVVAFIITIVICNQMTTHTTDKVGQLLIQGCSNNLNVKAGATP